MPEKRTSKEKNDTELKTFIKSGGRKGAESDFNKILKSAVKPNSSKKSLSPKKS